MNLILKNATIVDAESQFNHQIIDIEITNGVITNLEKNIQAKDNFDVIEKENLHVSVGWLDSMVVFGEPGFETTETIENGLLTAAKSGFTQVFIHSNTQPAIDNQAIIEFINKKADNKATKAHLVACLTKNSLGTDLSEVYDLKNAGAIGFGDYKTDNLSNNQLKIALQYTQPLNQTVWLQPTNKNLTGSGYVNEGEVSTKLGLKGIPNLVEEIALENAIALLEYTQGKLHIPIITTEKSVEIIKLAKTKKLNITCGTSVNHLVLTDEELVNFNANTKINPPLRTEKDRLALIEGVKNGIIDVITSDHCPVNFEDKNKEFDLAAYGSIGLESAFGALMTVLDHDMIIEKFTNYKTFNLEKNSINIGNNANLSLFNPKTNWIFKPENIQSFSKNSIMLQKNMQGVVYGIINENKIQL